jgi:hypothetical protein
MHFFKVLWIGVCLLAWVAGGIQVAGEVRPATTESAIDSASQKSPLVSGREIGDIVPSFYTRVVTGPMMNRSVCFVCRNGQRPVVMVLLRKLGPDLKPLLQEVDRLVNEHRAEGLRSFGVFISENPSDAISQVQTFAFDHKISLPLTVGGNSVGEPHCQNLSAQADATIVLYQFRRVVSRFAFRDGELKSPQVEAVTQSIQALLKQESRTGSQHSAE